MSGDAAKTPNLRHAPMSSVPGWAVATAVQGALARVARIEEFVLDGDLTSAEQTAQELGVDLERWLRDRRLR